MLCVIAAEGLVSRSVAVGAKSAPTRVYVFRLFIPLASFSYWCKHCTVLEVATNMRKFPMTSQRGIAANGHICRPVLVVALLAPTQGLHFQSLHPLSFLFTCTLHWYKHCTLLEVTTNVRKSPMTALCVIAAQILFCSPVLVGTLFATTHGLHFRALLPLSFLFMCTLHWCKHCTC